MVLFFFYKSNLPQILWLNLNIYMKLMMSLNGLLSSWQTEELQLVRDALRSLRNSFGGHDPQHHTLDTLEQGMASLMDRLYTLDSRTRHERKVREELLNLCSLRHKAYSH